MPAPKRSRSSSSHAGTTYSRVRRRSAIASGTVSQTPVTTSTVLRSSSLCSRPGSGIRALARANRCAASLRRSRVRRSTRANSHSTPSVGSGEPWKSIRTGLSVPHIDVRAAARARETIGPWTRRSIACGSAAGCRCAGGCSAGAASCSPSSSARSPPASPGGSPPRCSTTRRRSSRRSRRWCRSGRRTASGCGGSSRSPSGSRSASSSPTCSWSWIGSGAWQLALIVGLAMSAALLLDAGHPLRHPGRGAVDRRRDPAARSRRGADPVDRRAHRRWGRAGRRDRRAGGAAAQAARAGGCRRPQDRRAAPRRQPRDDRRRARSGARPAGRRAGDRSDDPRAPGRCGRGHVGRGFVPVPRAASRRPAPDGRAGGPARPGAAQHPGAGPADGGRGLPAPTGAGVVRRPHRRPRAGRRRGRRRAGGRPDAGGRSAARCSPWAQATGLVERSESLSGDAILAQLRSIVVDLLLVTGMGQLEATDALPPPRR